MLIIGGTSLEVGSAAQLGDELAKNLGSLKAMRRRISYLREVRVM